MEYLYNIGNASLTLRVVKYLQAMPHLPVRFITVVHLIDSWMVFVKMNEPLNSRQDGNVRAFLNELGIPFQPPMRVNMALASLEAGQSPTDVMRRYQIVVVHHGRPDQSEIEAFRHQFIRGLGYCPETLA